MSEKKSSTKKPSSVQSLKCYLLEPTKILVEFKQPKKIGNPLPLYYDLILKFRNEETIFEKIIIHDSNENKEDDSNKNNNDDNTKICKDNKYRIIIFNCDQDSLYKIAIDTYNNKSIKNKSSTALQRINTVSNPSMITNLKCMEGIITFDEPKYVGFGNLTYELMQKGNIDTYLYVHTYTYICTTKR